MIYMAPHVFLMRPDPLRGQVEGVGRLGPGNRDLPLWDGIELLASAFWGPKIST